MLPENIKYVEDHPELMQELLDIRASGQENIRLLKEMIRQVVEEEKENKNETL